MIYSKKGKLKIDIPLWRRNDTAFFFLPSCGPVYPRQGLLGNPLLVFEPPRCAICHPYKLAYPSGPPWHSVAQFFYCHHPNPSLKCIFKIHLLNMLDSSPFCKNYQSLICMDVKNPFMQWMSVIVMAQRDIDMQQSKWLTRIWQKSVHRWASTHYRNDNFHTILISKLDVDTTYPIVDHSILFVLPINLYSHH